MFKLWLVMVAIGINIAVGLLGYGLDWFNYTPCRRPVMRADNIVICPHNWTATQDPSIVAHSNPNPNPNPNHPVLNDKFQQVNRHIFHHLFHILQ